MFYLSSDDKDQKVRLWFLRRNLKGPWLSHDNSAHIETES